MKVAATWLSLHCFIADPRRQDAFLVDRIVPMLRGDGIERWFFIRYWEGGPHLRLRVCGALADQPGRLAAALADGIAGYLSAVPLGRADYYAAHGFDGAPVDVAALPWFAEGNIAPIAYVPELQRYGGAAAMAASEQLFARSSAVAAALVRATPGDTGRRTALAFQLMAATGLALAGSMAGVAAFMGDYAAGWAQYSPANRALAARLAADPAVDAGHVVALQGLAGDRGHPLTTAWAGDVAALVAHLHELAAAGQLVSPRDGTIAGDAPAVRAAIAAIIGSQVHMLNNRLGLAPAAELILATHIARAAAAVPGPVLEMVA